MKSRYRVTGSATVLLTSFLLTSAQSSVPNTSSWRDKPVRLANPGTAAIEQARSKYVDSLVGLMGYTIDTAAGAGVRSVVTSHEADIGELPINSSDSVAIATFSSYTVHATLSRRSLYTIIQFRCKKLVKDLSAHLRVDQTFPVLMLGGSAVLDNGISATYGYSSADSSLLPGHRYLLFLQYNPSGSFYTVSKSWDLTQGGAKPNSTFDRAREQQGISSIAGKSEDEVLLNLGAKR